MPFATAFLNNCSRPRGVLPATVAERCAACARSTSAPVNFWIVMVSGGSNGNGTVAVVSDAKIPIGLRPGPRASRLDDGRELRQVAVLAEHFVGRHHRFAAEGRRVAEPDRHGA